MDEEKKSFAEFLKARIRENGGSLESAAKEVGMNSKQALYGKLKNGTFRSTEERALAAGYGYQVVWQESEELFQIRMKEKAERLRQGLCDYVEVQQKEKESKASVFRMYGQLEHILGEIIGAFEERYGTQEGLKKRKQFFQKMNLHLPFEND